MKAFQVFVLFVLSFVLAGCQMGPVPLEQQPPQQQEARKVVLELLKGRIDREIEADQAGAQVSVPSVADLKRQHAFIQLAMEQKVVVEGDWLYTALKDEANVRMQADGDSINKGEKERAPLAGTDLYKAQILVEGELALYRAPRKPQTPQAPVAAAPTKEPAPAAADHPKPAPQVQVPEPAPRVQLPVLGNQPKR